MSPETQKVIEMVQIIIENTSFNFDQSKYGRVIDVLSDNRYKVQIRDKIQEIKSLFNYIVNERVLVLFPCGNDKDLYIYPNKPNVIASDIQPNIDTLAEGDIWIET